MPLSVTLGNLRDEAGGQVLPDPAGVVPRVCESVNDLDGAFPLLRKIDGQEETILNWLEVRPLRAEVLQATEQLGLSQEARPVLAVLGEWSTLCIDMVWFLRVVDA